MKWVILIGAGSAAFSRSPAAGLIRTGWPAGPALVDITIPPIP
jgi:hypothetical protein